MPMGFVSEIEIARRDLSLTRVNQRKEFPLEVGQIRLRIDRFALTANSVTYAVLGDALKYWDFFSAESPDLWGVLPVWGFATVTESRQPRVREGHRFYGFYPMATEAVLQPGRITPAGFFDIDPHRAHLHPAYKRYFDCAQDPLYTPDTEEVQALLRPLFITSWLIGELLLERQDFGARRAVISSASSKTAYGTALQLHRTGRLEVVGLTSKKNVAFCESLGCYDQVVDYGAVGTLDPGYPTVYIDFSGNKELYGAVQLLCGDLRHGLSIGYTHLSETNAANGSVAQGFTKFFAPDEIRKRNSEWGAEEFSRRLAQAYDDFYRFCTAPRSGSPLLVVRAFEGPAQVQASYLELLQGGDPSLGRVATMNEPI